ncbi:transmission trait enhancer LetE [Legionella israelensis]|uniref:transmission trait enhancer LetE n=1 Tax=Legionella israelensis TaxID=454 RepID=UPI00117E90F1|nr:transmission trait enhancer LetE [Legionella israelensis]QDP73509.1 transmission trait enhancer LetE [Legionella israelensis]
MNDINTLLPHVRLRFNIEHPSYEECYVFGYECAVAKLDIEENPYPETSVEAEQWNEGWWAGFYGEEPLFAITPTPVQTKTIDAAANDNLYQQEKNFFSKVWKITGALAASAVIGYQVIDLVA